MADAFTSDRLQDLAKFPFSDPQWKNKFLIGSLLMLAGFVIPWIPTVFVYGYCAQIMRRIIVEKGDPALPVWDDWGKLFQEGLNLMGVSLIYSLPGLVLFCGGYGLFLVTAIGAGAMSEAAPRDDSSLAAIIALIGSLGGFGVFGLGMLLLLVGFVIQPVAAGHVIATGEFAAAFRVREWWAILRANPSGYLMAYVIILGLWMALTFALQILYFTVVLCCLVPFVLSFIMMYVLIIGSVLFGQAYQVGAGKWASPAITA